LPNHHRAWRRQDSATTFSAQVGLQAKFLPFLLAAVTFLATCSLFRPKPLTQNERHKLAIDIHASIDKAGGTRVWTKSEPANEPFLQVGGRGTSGEVLATRDVWDGVLGAVKATAHQDGFQVEVHPAKSQGELRTLEVSLSRGTVAAGLWRLREVRQLRRASIIMDDLGQDLNAAHRLLELPFPLTFSILPELRDSRRIAEEAHRQGREVMLHLPMEPEPGAPTFPGPGEIKVGMSGEAVASMIAADLESVPYARGVNNHMGSRATADAALMTSLMRVLEERRLYFVDSRTTAHTTALAVARRMRVPAFYRSVFLDDTASVEYTLRQLRRLRRIIEEQGAALAIGHPHPTTIAALREFLPSLERDDIQLVPASGLVYLPEVARLSPPTGKGL
jgi:polysaccharide deacetylase 2 family uncharacterized protein YibQ